LTSAPLKQDLWRMTCFLGNNVITVREISPPKSYQRDLTSQQEGEDNALLFVLSCQTTGGGGEGRLVWSRQLVSFKKEIMEEEKEGIGRS
jgi:hypothetical protein